MKGISRVLLSASAITMLLSFSAFADVPKIIYAPADGISVQTVSETAANVVSTEASAFTTIYAPVKENTAILTTAVAADPTAPGIIHAPVNEAETTQAPAAQVPAEKPAIIYSAENADLPKPAAVQTQTAETAKPASANKIFAPGTAPASDNYNADNNGEPIEIVSKSLCVNSVNGATPTIQYNNVSGKTIDHIDFTLTPVSRGGNTVKCDLRGYTSYTGRVYGPVEPTAQPKNTEYAAPSDIIIQEANGSFCKYNFIDHSYSRLSAEELADLGKKMARFDAAWYNNGITDFNITGINVSFADGTSKAVDTAKINNPAAYYFHVDTAPVISGDYVR